MRILVFQHLSIEHPGLFLDLWREAGHEWTVIELDEDGVIPDLTPFGLLAVMGGPMNVSDEAVHPWLKAEKAAIRRWVRELRRPYLGICLGHQLLADALGGEVGPMPGPEVGVGPVTLTDAGRVDPALSVLGRSFEALHWHGAEVRRLPEGAVSLAATPSCGCQAMRCGPAYGLQFHMEVTAAMVEAWSAVDDYRDSLEAVCGREAVPRLMADVEAAGRDSAALAKRFNDAFFSTIAPVSIT